MFLGKSDGIHALRPQGFIWGTFKVTVKSSDQLMLALKNNKLNWNEELQKYIDKGKLIIEKGTSFGLSLMAESTEG
jgi:hypothetical protein